ncbi:hypothetical protein TH53_24385 [Pedobacter lusitanus]|uniref:Contig135, whole genome shotgun sequence n=1 Tax=Pedobacter lusitanus TaxID=1503925 RepID=A0A0D0GK80_9SPHI|nr:HmuY family protein [Pedobacter lusitanus]KIO74791.1 hypothetical protein TH53_24385 [Pedobacter lusitanus]
MNKHKVIILYSFAVFAFAGCKKDNVDYKYPQPFDGQTTQLQGIAGTELGVNAANSVYVDFSTGRITPVNRTSWSVGLYPGKEFKLIINHSMGATVFQTDKTNLADISTADSATMASAGTLDFTSPNIKKLVDPVTGLAADYLNGLVIKDIPMTEGESKVYILNSGKAGMAEMTVPTTADPTSRKVVFPWYKFKVYQGINGYIMQFARIGVVVPKYNDPSYNKDLSYNFNYINFASGAVNPEPAKALWDIEWTWTTYQDANGVPVRTNNFVLINFLGGVSAAQLTGNTTLNFDNFTAANLANLKPEDYLATRDAIGVKWRRDVGTDGQTSVIPNLFYVIKDAENNYYKLRFKSSSNIDGGAAGKPVIEYRLVQSAPNPGI